MFASRSFLLMALIQLSAVAPVVAQDHASGSRRNLIVMSEEKGLDPNSSALELVRRRLPLVVTRGRFATDEGAASVCVYARRSAARIARAEPVLAGLQPCPMIVLVIDGIRASDAGGYLDLTRLSDLESMELVGAAEANMRYGLAASGAEVLALWTRGRGPHARRSW